MAKRRPHFEALEHRLCLTSGPVLQTTVTLPVGSWTSAIYRASPIYDDIFGTGKEDLIAVASGAQLVAYSENADGSATPVVTYQIPNGIADISSTPIIVTNPSTGRADLFAATSLYQTGTATVGDGLVFGWDLQTGKLLPGVWSTGVSTGTQPNGQSGVVGALTSGDLQGNGIPDIVATSWSHEVTAITLQGTVLWQWDNDDTILCGAVVADIDRSGTPDVIVGGDSSANPSIDFQNGGWVTVLSNTGQVKWRKQLPGEVTWSSPVVADLQNNGYLDIIIGTGLNFSATLGGNYTAAGDYIYALDPFGNTLPGWPYYTGATDPSVPHEVLNAPAVADITGNGQLDVVAIDRAGYLHVVQPNGQDLPGFVGGVRIDPQLPQTATPDDYASPIIADVTGSNKPEIIATASDVISAFNSSGNIISIGTTPLGTGGSPEGVDDAPAVGNFDGTGGLCLAIATYDATNTTEPNRPDKVVIYQLPTSTLTPPWPFLRRTVSGDAVMRSTVYDQAYVTRAFNVLLGSQPSTATVQTYVAALNSDTTNLLSTAQLIAISPVVVQAEVNKVYEEFLGRTADAGGLAYWSTYLENSPLRQMEISVASSAEFAQRAGNSLSQEVTLLYQAMLGRTPSAAEVAAWVATKEPIGSIASAITASSEFITDEFNATIQAMYGAGSQSQIPPDDLAAYMLDSHAGLTEAELTSEVMASEANYAATNFTASYIQNLFRDVLNRDGSAAEIASWLTAVGNGSVAVTSIASDFLNSTESRQDYIQAEFQTLLGHTTDATTLTNLTSLSREQVLIFLVGSAEFYAKSGGTNASFVAAAFLDLGGIVANQSTINAIVAQMNAGQTTAGVAQGIIYSGTLYFSTLVVNQLTQYIPNEAEGVLRTGVLSAGAAGQPINPDPGLIAYFVSLYQSGLSDQQVLSIMLTSPQYISTVSFYRGLYRSIGIRN